MLDAFLYCYHQGKALAYMVDVDLKIGEFVPAPAAEYLSMVLPDGVAIDAIDTVDRKSPNYWCLISCNAHYDVHGPRNHFVPRFFREQLSVDTWFDLTMMGNATNRLALRRAKKKVMDFEESMSTAQNPDDENLLMQLQDLKDEAKRLKRWVEMRERYQKIGCALFEVPCDGNCCIWSLMLLQQCPDFGVAGFFNKKSPVFGLKSPISRCDKNKSARHPLQTSAHKKSTSGSWNSRSGQKKKRNVKTKIRRQHQARSAHWEAIQLSYLETSWAQKQSAGSHGGSSSRHRRSLPQCHARWTHQKEKKKEEGCRGRCRNGREG